MKKFDAVIIGFGKGGKTLAADLAEQGKRVALIERSEEMYGGTCINVGCIPSKSQVVAAKNGLVGEADGFEDKSDRYKRAAAERSALVLSLRAKNYHKLADHPNVTVFRGTGRFVSPHEVEISGERTEVVFGVDIFINTGASAFLPPISGLKESRYAVTSDYLLKTDVLPRRLVIIGGGYIGMEFASMYAEFGSEVTVLQNGNVFLPREDEDIAAAVRQTLENRGVRFIMGADTERIADREGYAEVTYSAADSRAVLPAELVLVATGRRPNTAELNLAAAGVEQTKNGGVKVDGQMRTTCPHIYAMGDVTGGPQFTFVSLDDYRIVKSALAGGSRSSEGRVIPYSVFIDPPLSRAGLTEREAKEKGLRAKTAVMPAAALAKSHILRRPEGLMKVTVDEDNGLVLGASLFCEESPDMINLITLAMRYNLPYTALRDHIYTHPVMTEALNELLAKI